MYKKKEKSSPILDIDKFPQDQLKQLSIQGVLPDALCVSVCESHQLIAMIDLYGDLQIYDMIKHTKIEYFSNKFHSEEIEYALDPNNSHDIYYNLHFCCGTWNNRREEEEEKGSDEERKLNQNNEIILCFINGYQNKIVTYSLTPKISVKREVKVPYPFAITCSAATENSELIMLGNTVGCISFYDPVSGTFFSLRVDYSDVIEELMPLRTKVKNISQSPIFAPMMHKDSEIKSDNGVVLIKSDISSNARLLVAYRNNLVVLYDLTKKEVLHAFDIPEVFRENIDGDGDMTKPIISDTSICIDGKYILVSVLSGHILIFKISKKTSKWADKCEVVKQVSPESVNFLKVHPYWKNKSSKELYSKTGHNCFISVSGKQVEHIDNIESELSVQNYTQLTQQHFEIGKDVEENEASKLAMESKILLHKPFFCLLSPTWKLNSKDDLNELAHQIEVKEKDIGKIEFIECFNSLFYSQTNGIAEIQVYNHRIDPLNVENVPMNIYKNPEMTERQCTISKLCQADPHTIHRVKLPGKEGLSLLALSTESEIELYSYDYKSVSLFQKLPCTSKIIHCEGQFLTTESTILELGWEETDLVIKNTCKLPEGVKFRAQKYFTMKGSDSVCCCAVDSSGNILIFGVFKSFSGESLQDFLRNQGIFKKNVLDKDLMETSVRDIDIQKVQKGLKVVIYGNEGVIIECLIETHEGNRFTQQIYDTQVKYAIKANYCAEFDCSVLVCRKEIHLYCHKTFEKETYNLKGVSIRQNHIKFISFQNNTLTVLGIKIPSKPIPLLQIIQISLQNSKTLTPTLKTQIHPKISCSQIHFLGPLHPASIGYLLLTDTSLYTLHPPTPSNLHLSTSFWLEAKAIKDKKITQISNKSNFIKKLFKKAKHTFSGHDSGPRDCITHLLQEDHHSELEKEEKKKIAEKLEEQNKKKLGLDTKEEHKVASTTQTSQAQNQADEVKAQLQMNIQALNERGDQIDELGEKTQQLKDASMNFLERAKQLNQQQKKSFFGW
ncbi:unnamed protein product [Moneuplotes crassus]|uniref:V-SNARE coiled-coil homology domain-containing protein n=1 Tax=Euplotes crassus TaxID=5936 RepID=A0AAD1XU36_EUPCR|nr:unnamed protein product [Moneuplotes crassus]